MAGFLGNQLGTRHFDVIYERGLQDIVYGLCRKSHSTKFGCREFSEVRPEGQTSSGKAHGEAIGGPSAATVSAVRTRP